jgi:dynein heavy chain
VKIQRWFIQKLPQEDFAVDNAIIMDNSERWPLMIDPQMQGNAWVKMMEKDSKYAIIKPTMDVKVQVRHLKNSVSLGYPVILEDANE